MVKNIYVVCPTYRKRHENSFREIGILFLIERVLHQNNIRLCIVDSSSKPLSIFENKPAINNNIIYLHAPSKKEMVEKYSSIVPKAVDFCITKEHKNFASELERVSSWSNFIPWDKDFPSHGTLKSHFLQKRPSIGMKRNIAIAALDEIFNDGDVICYADDDDFRTAQYFNDMASFLRDNDFIRISKWLTCCFDSDPNNPICGIHNISFKQDINGYFSLQKRKSDTLFNSKNINFCGFSVEEHYSKIKNLAFSPISYDGAMHVFSTQLWRKSVEAFGGIPPVSLGEDTCFFKSCQNYFGKNFKYDLINNKKLNFLRGSGNNASLIQWTDNISIDAMPQWASQTIRNVFALLKFPEKLHQLEYKISCSI